MPLIERLSKDDTIHEFKAAAQLRLKEAFRLGAADDRLGAIYLAGYAVEMLLKAAYFRLEGKAHDAPISKKDMEKAKNDAKTILNVAWVGALHNLNGWTELLVQDRMIRGKPYSRKLARALQAYTKRIYLNWRETLRYKANRPYRGEVTAVLLGAKWLLGHYRYL